MSRLHDLLVANDKKKIFKFNTNAAIGYPSGLLPLDFQNGYTVIGEAENGAKAVEKYAELKPDLVLMDITMPEMDGIQALKKITFPQRRTGDNHGSPLLLI